MHRFYREVGREAAADGWRVLLDGRPLRTPAGRSLAMPTLALADAIADEWRAQSERIRPDRMPMMRFAATTLDRIGPHRDATVREVAGYAATDLLCYRCDREAALAAQEARLWQPLLDWAAERYGAALAVTAGILPVAQADDDLVRLRQAVAWLDDFRLTALAAAVQTTGSLIIGLALLENRVSAAEAAAAALLDERYQAERWGYDSEADDRRRRLAAEIAEARRFLDLVSDSPAGVIDPGKAGAGVHGGEQGRVDAHAAEADGAGDRGAADGVGLR